MPSIRSILAVAFLTMAAPTPPALALSLDNDATKPREHSDLTSSDRGWGTEGQASGSRSSGLSYWGNDPDRVPLDDRGLPIGIQPPRDRSNEYWGAPLLEAPGRPPR